MSVVVQDWSWFCVLVDLEKKKKKKNPSGKKKKKNIRKKCKEKKFFFFGFAMTKINKEYFETMTLCFKYNNY